MTDSVGGAIARGLQTGLQIGTGLVDRQRNRELQDEDRRIRAEDRSRRMAQEDRLLEKDQDAQTLAALNDEAANIKGEFEGLLSQYGGFDKVPEAERARLTQRQRDAYRRRQEFNDKRLRPLVERERSDASKLFADIQAGRIKPEDVPDDQFYRAVGVVTRRKPEELLRGEQGSSQIGQAIQGLLSQFETPGSPEDMLSAVNTILAPELSQGIGSPGRDGSEIVKKEIVRLLPAPNSKDKFLPVLKVTVRRPDGALGSYMAPVTAGRSSDADDDEVTTLDVGQAMDYVGQLGTFEELVNAPGIREKILRGAKTGAPALEEFRAAYAQSGAKPIKRKITAANVDRGDKVTRITTDQETGEEIKREDLPKGINPNVQATVNARVAAGNRARGVQLTIGEIDRMVEDGDITEEEGVELKKQALVRPRGVGAGDKPMSESERKVAGQNAETAKAKEMGLQWNADRKTWVTADGKKASTEQLAQIAKAGADALARTQTLTRDGRANPQAPMDPAQRKVGQTYMTPKGPMIWRGQGWEPAGAAK